MGTSEKMIWLILFLAALLRLISLDQSLWLDEAINVLAAKNYSLLGIVTEYAKGDFHPPGYFIVLWVWTKIFGYTEIAVRLPSIIFGILTIWITFLIGQKIHSKSLGFIAALFLAVNPLHIYYSQEARMYSLAALVVSINMLFFLNLVKGEKSNGRNLGFYILSNLLVLVSDYVSYLIFPAQLAFFLIGHRTRFLKKWLIVLLLSLGIFSIWLPIFMNQLQAGLAVSSSIPAWKEVVGSFGLKPLILTYVKFIIGRIDHPDPLIYGSLFLIPGLLFLFLMWRGIRFASDFNKKLLSVWLIIPIVSALLISLTVPIYSYFRLLFILPSFMMLISLGVLSFKPKFRNFLIIPTILVEVIAATIYLFNSQFQREDWKGLVSFLGAKGDSHVLLESTGLFAPFEYYSENRIEADGALKEFPAEIISNVSNLEFLDGKKDVYLVDYLVEISDPKRLVSQKLMELGYQKLDIKNFSGVGFVYHYFKNE
ncbi:MAG: glycosyltransferase family 39 protein [Candidatus Daviesbacteria bacterium]|nr:glycosyltransferase family 39 protein [Candidatus Daviesbacteria bacterium]